jgi:hypothetical protein
MLSVPTEKNHQDCGREKGGAGGSTARNKRSRTYIDTKSFFVLIWGTQSLSSSRHFRYTVYVTKPSSTDTYYIHDSGLLLHSVQVMVLHDTKIHTKKYSNSVIRPYSLFFKTT